MLDSLEVQCAAREIDPALALQGIDTLEIAVRQGRAVDMGEVIPLLLQHHARQRSALGGNVGRQQFAQLTGAGRVPGQLPAQVHGLGRIAVGPGVHVADAFGAFVLVIMNRWSNKDAARLTAATLPADAPGAA